MWQLCDQISLQNCYISVLGQAKLIASFPFSGFSECRAGERPLFITPKTLEKTLK